MTPVRLCLEPRCPDLATYRGRCQRHARSKDRSTNRKGRRIYNTKRWAIIRRAVLNAEPFCRMCAERGVETLATEVDHIVPLANGGDPYSLANLQPLDHHCHSVKTRKEQATNERP